MPQFKIHRNSPGLFPITALGKIPIGLNWYTYRTHLHWFGNPRRGVVQAKQVRPDLGGFGRPAKSREKDAVHHKICAVALDRYWNVVLANDSLPIFFTHLIDMHTRKGSRNILHLMFDPAGMRPFIDNWKQIAPPLLRRVYREAGGP